MAPMGGVGVGLSYRPGIAGDFRVERRDGIHIGELLRIDPSVIGVFVGKHDFATEILAQKRDPNLELARIFSEGEHGEWLPHIDRKSGLLQDFPLKAGLRRFLPIHSPADRFPNARLMIILGAALEHEYFPIIPSDDPFDRESVLHCDFFGNYGFIIAGSNPILGNKKQGSLQPRFSVLAWRDSFRTLEWGKAFPDPTASLSQMQELLALHG